MAINEFTSQSAWISVSNATDTELVISGSNTWTTLTLSSLATLSRYNFESSSSQLKPQIKGVYLLNACMTTSGASNNLLGIRMGVGNGGGFTYATPELIYTSKGGNEWAVNYNAIMQLYRLNTGTDHFIIQGKNVGATNNITFNYLNISIVKLY